MNRLTMKEQRELLLAVGVLLSDAEDPQHVTTETAMCGKRQLDKVGKVWRRVWKRVHQKTPQ